MSKLISILAAAMFAAVSVSAVAQTKGEKKKDSKVVKKDGKMVGGTKDTKKKADKK